MKNPLKTTKSTTAGAKAKNIQQDNLAQKANGKAGTSYAEDTAKNKEIAKKRTKK